MAAPAIVDHRPVFSTPRSPPKPAAIGKNVVKPTLTNEDDPQNLHTASMVALVESYTGYVCTHAVLPHVPETETDSSCAWPPRPRGCKNDDLRPLQQVSLGTRGTSAAKRAEGAPSTGRSGSSRWAALPQTPSWAASASTRCAAAAAT